MSKTFRIILSVMTVLAFALLYICTKDEVGIIALPILILALIGAIKIIWKKEVPKGQDNEEQI